MSPNRRATPKNHRSATCPCVACRVARGERPNPHRVKTGARSRNYLWMNDAQDRAVTDAAKRLGVSKSRLVRDGVLGHLERLREASQASPSALHGGTCLPHDPADLHRLRLSMLAFLLRAWSVDGSPCRVMAYAATPLVYARNAAPLQPDLFVSLLSAELEKSVASAGEAYDVFAAGSLPSLCLDLATTSEDEDRLSSYSKAGIPYVLLFQPPSPGCKAALRAYVRRGVRYTRCTWDECAADLGIGLTVSEGVFLGEHGSWLRWCDAAGAPICHATEPLLEQALQRVHDAEVRASAAEQRAHAAETRLHELERQLTSDDLQD